jgi:multiple sugar transport system ATP-binding protein
MIDRSPLSCRCAAPLVRSEELKEVVGAEALEAADEQTHHLGTPFVARVSRESAAREGERVELAVVTSRMHFFDLETGAAIYDGAAAEAAPAASARAAS